MISYLVGTLIKISRIMRVGSGITYDLLVVWSIVHIIILIKIVNPRLILYGAALLIAIRVAFILNNITDINEDLNNPLGKQKNPLVSDPSLMHVAGLLAACLSLLGLLLFILYSSFLAIILYLGVLLLGATYSLPPRWKTSLFLDMISHGLFFGALLPLTLFIAYGLDLTLAYIMILLSIFVFSSVFELSNHIRDFHYDLKAGICTTAIFLGYKRSLYLNKVLLSLAIIIGHTALILTNIRISIYVMVQALIILLTLSYQKHEKILGKLPSTIMLLLLAEFSILSALSSGCF